MQGFGNKFSCVLFLIDHLIYLFYGDFLPSPLRGRLNFDCNNSLFYIKLKLKRLFFDKANFFPYGCILCIFASQTELTIDSQTVVLFSRINA